MATIQIRIDDDLKEEVQKICDKMGLSLSSAIRLFLQQVVIHNGLPFEPTANSEEEVK